MKEIVLSHADVMHILPDRPLNSHKGSYGKILLLCGSLGYTGAAAMAAMGALRCGAGLVYLGVPESIYVIEAVKLLEPVVFPLSDANGMFSADSIPEVLTHLEGKDAVLIGPGIGISGGTRDVVEAVLCNFNGPVVLDADGINLLAGHTDILRGRQADTILTPHSGEFARIGGRSGDRVNAAAKLARELNSVIVLKGHGTVITDGISVYRNPTGNPGMAVGGSGDVLSGMITALVGQKIPPLEAAACGAWLHGKAGDLCAENMGQYGMLPSDMLTVLPRLMK